MNFSTQEDIRNQNLENRQNVGVEKEVLEQRMISTLQEVSNVRGNTRNSIVGGELAIETKNKSLGSLGNFNSEEKHQNTIEQRINPEIYEKYKDYINGFNKNFKKSDIEQPSEVFAKIWHNIGK